MVFLDFFHHIILRFYNFFSTSDGKTSWISTRTVEQLFSITAHPSHKLVLDIFLKGMFASNLFEGRPGIPELFYPSYFSELSWLWRHNWSYVTSFLRVSTEYYDVITKIITWIFFVPSSFRVILFYLGFFFSCFHIFELFDKF